MRTATRTRLVSYVSILLSAVLLTSLLYGDQNSSIVLDEVAGGTISEVPDAIPGSSTEDPGDSMNVWNTKALRSEDDAVDESGLKEASGSEAVPVKAGETEDGEDASDTKELSTGGNGKNYKDPLGLYFNVFDPKNAKVVQKFNSKYDAIGFGKTGKDAVDIGAGKNVKEGSTYWNVLDPRNAKVAAKLNSRYNAEFGLSVNDTAKGAPFNVWNPASAKKAAALLKQYDFGFGDHINMSSALSGISNGSLVLVPAKKWNRFGHWIQTFPESADVCPDCPMPRKNQRVVPHSRRWQRAQVIAFCGANYREPLLIRNCIVKMLGSKVKYSPSLYSERKMGKVGKESSGKSVPVSVSAKGGDGKSAGKASKAAGKASKAAKAAGKAAKAAGKAAGAKPAKT